MTAYVSLIVALVGVVVWAVSTNPKAAEIGRIMFAFGLLAWLLIFDRIVTFPPR